MTLAPMQTDGLLTVSDKGIQVLPAGRLLIRNICMVFDKYLATKTTATVFKSYLSRLMNDDRIIELEIKAAYQEDLLQELNKIVGQQQQQIKRLEATCRLLNERIKSLSIEGGSGENIDEVPPHY